MGRKVALSIASKEWRQGGIITKKGRIMIEDRTDTDGRRPYHTLPGFLAAFAPRFKAYRFIYTGDLEKNINYCVIISIKQ